MVTNTINADWQIRYSKYVGDLIIFDDDIYSKEKKELELKKNNDGELLVFEKQNGRLLMVKLENPEKIVPNIDIMNKSCIINKIKEYISHGQNIA